MDRMPLTPWDKKRWTTERREVQKMEGVKRVSIPVLGEPVSHDWSLTVRSWAQS